MGQVFVNGEKRNELIGRQVRRLGGLIASRLSKRVTHVLFLDGRRRLLDAARLRPDLQVVSINWVEELGPTTRTFDELSDFMDLS